MLAAAIVWALPAWLTRYDVGSVTPALVQTARDAARGRLLTLGAGLLAAGALVFTARNFILSREGQVTDRYTKAIEQLGSKELGVRIGGIYALERIARDPAEDHPTVMEVLTAFIRDPTREPWPPPDAGSPEQKRSTRPDVQAALTVVGRRDARRDIRRIDLTRADLTRAYLTRAYLTRVDLRRAILYGADLTGAALTIAWDLTGADLTNAADLTGAHLEGADLAGAHLRGARLAGADLTRAHLNFADLRGADLIDATLDGATLEGATLEGADLDGADLDGAWWPEGAPVPDGWTADSGSGQLKPAGGLSEVMDHYPW